MINMFTKPKNNFKYLTIEELKTLSLQQEIDNAKIILILENKYFDLVKITIETDLDENERELVIESQLEEKILNYNPVDFVEKEIILKEKDGSQNILIILIKREIIKEIIDKHINKINLYSLFPFFLVREIKKIEDSKTIICDFCENRVLFTVLYNDKIIDIESYLIEKEEILSNEMEQSNLIIKVNNILEKFENIDSFVFFNKDMEIKNILLKEITVNNIDEIYISEKNDFPLESLNFLPQEYIDEIKSKNFKKVLFSLLLLFFILQLIYFTISGFIESKKQDKINLQNKEISTLTLNISDNKNSIEKIDDYQDKIDSLKKLMGTMKIDFSDILARLEHHNYQNIKINNIEYNETKKIQISGISNSDTYLYELIENISQDTFFNNINHDYIKKVDDSFQFQFDMGVKID